MKRPVIATVIIVIVIAAAAFAIFGGKDKNDNSNQPSSSASQSSNSTNNSNSSQQPSSTSTDKVSIANFAFSPTDITVKKGTKVTWTNNDSTTHTITSEDEHGPSSDNVSPGQSYTFTFADEGTFNYHCSIHPQMTGTVTVTE